MPISYRLWSEGHIHGHATTRGERARHNYASSEKKKRNIILALSGISGGHVPHFGHVDHVSYFGSSDHVPCFGIVAEGSVRVAIYFADAELFS